MNINDVMALANAGFSRNDIFQLAQMEQDTSNVQQPIVQPTVQVPTTPVPQAQGYTMPQTPPTVPQGVPPIQNPQSQTPAPALPPTTQTSTVESSMLSFLQNLQAKTAGMDIPPARTTNDILGERMMDLLGGTVPVNKGENNNG